MIQNIIFKKHRNNFLKAFLLLSMFSVQFLHAGNIFLKNGGITTATRATAGTAGFGNTWATALDFNSYFNLYAGQNTLANTIPANTTIYIKADNYTWNSTLTVVLINNNILIQGGFPSTAVGTDISGYNPLVNVTKVTLTGGTSVTGRWLGTSSVASGSNTSEMKGMEITSTNGGSFFFGNADSGGTPGNYKFTDLNIHDFPNGGGTIVFRDNGAGATGTFTNCVFTSNATGSNGAAIDNDNAVCPLTFTNCSFTSNAGTGTSFGGAIFTRSNITATNTSWCSNSSGGFGGAIGNDVTTSKTYTFNGCTFSKNTAANGYGGAIGVKYGNLIINNCNFYENETKSGSVGGGAIYLQNNSSGTSTITNTVFYKNKFTYTASLGNFGGGGAIGWTDLSGTLTISGSKFVDNWVSVAHGYGGAICIDNSTGGSGNITINNSIFKGNNLAGGASTAANSDLGIRTNLTAAAEYRITNSLMQQLKPNYYSGGTSTTSYQPFANNAGAAPYNYFFDTIPYSVSQTASTNTFNNTSDGGVGTPTFNCPTAINTVVAISGQVWNDADGNVAINGSEIGTNAGGLFANLVASSGTVVDSVPVGANGTYSGFTYPLDGSAYKIVISTSASGSTANLPSGWNNTGETIGTNTATQSATLGQIELPTSFASTTLPNQNFGIKYTAPCTNTIYVVNDSNFSTLSGSTFTLIGTPPAALNALGYNQQDGFLYAVAASSNVLYKISTTGTFTNLGAITNGPTGAGSGTITPSGIFYFNVSGGTILYRVDLNGTAPYTATTITTTTTLNSDIVYNPYDGFLYSASGNGDVIRKINPITGATTTISAAFPFPNNPTSSTIAGWIDQAGTLLYVYQGSPTNQVVTYNLKTGAISSTSASGSMTNGDAATCANGITISGTVFNDSNGLTDSIVNGIGTNVGGTLYAILYDNFTGAVVDYKLVPSSGVYSFSGGNGDNFSVYLSTTAPTLGQTAVPTVTFPTDWMSIGEQNCVNTVGCTGNDGTPDGILPLGVVSSSITQANFGVKLSVCTQPAIGGTPDGYTQTGISSFEGFAGGWPGNIPNGFIAIESKTKGFVITRTTTSAIPAAGLVEGMLIYDTTDNCVKLYNGTIWHCIEKSCNTP